MAQDVRIDAASDPGTFRDSSASCPVPEMSLVA
jgi:hypothetical protein